MVYFTGNYNTLFIVHPFLSKYIYVVCICVYTKVNIVFAIFKCSVLQKLLTTQVKYHKNTSCKILAIKTQLDFLKIFIKLNL